MRRSDTAVIVAGVLGWVAIFFGLMLNYAIGHAAGPTGNGNPLWPWIGWGALAMVAFTVFGIVWLVRRPRSDAATNASDH
ncbi:MAG: hypothetical protein ABIQ01_12660 [Pseudolysinimonas sp.]